MLIKWNRRPGGHLVEHDVRRVCRDQAEGSTGARELADFIYKIIRHPGEVVRSHEVESLLQINAVNYELRITPIAGALAIERYDFPVIINRAFRAEAANDSKSLHVLTTNGHEYT